VSADPRYKLDFALSRIIRYNGKRLRFFDKLHRLSSFVNAAAGTSAFVTVLSGWPELAAWLTAIIALVSATDSVVGFSERARKFGDQRSKYFELYCDLLETEPAKFNEDHFRAKRLKIDSDGPPPLRVLDVICRNEEDIARGFPIGDTIHIGRVRRLLCQFIDLPPREWIKIEDRQSRHGADR
jgi:hypothetical protein